MKFGTLARVQDARNCTEDFRKIREMGLNACQLVYKPPVYTEEDARLIRRAADENGVEISAQFCGFRDSFVLWDIYYDYALCGINNEAFRQSRLEYLFQGAQFVQWLGITDMVIHAGFVPNNPFSPEYAAMLSSVKVLARRCRSLGVNLLFETGGESPITLLRLIEDVGEDNLFINLDTANILMYGYGNPVDALYTFGKYVRNLHAKDGLPPTDPRRLGPEVPLGTGRVDFPAVFSRLRELGYDRYVIIEREIGGEEQARDIRTAFGYLKKILAQCGYPIPACGNCFGE